MSGNMLSVDADLLATSRVPALVSADVEPGAHHSTSLTTLALTVSFAWHGVPSGRVRLF